MCAAAEVRTGYLAEERKKSFDGYPEGEVQVYVMGGVFSPSDSLLEKWSDGDISWQQYRSMYIDEIKSDGDAVRKVDRLAKTVVRGNDVRLICFEKKPPCHRFIVKELVEDKVDEYSSKMCPRCGFGLKTNSYRGDWMVVRCMGCDYWRAGFIGREF